MDDRCSYGDCRGSQKNSCSCDRRLKYCEYHIEGHLEALGSHSIRPLLKLEDQGTPSLLAKEMKTLSSTMSKVMLTGKEMFEEVCKKLCQITSELTERQDKLIEMASNLSQTQSLPLESFKDLGDLKLKFKTSEDFKKLVDYHFSNESSLVDFSLFSEDIKSIMGHLSKSNELLEEVRSQSHREKESREEIKTRLARLENSTLQIEQNLQNSFRGQDIEIQEREQRFFLNERTHLLQERELAFEQLLEIQDSKIEEVICKLDSTANRLIVQMELNHVQEKKMKELNEYAQNQIDLQF